MRRGLRSAMKPPVPEYSYSTTPVSEPEPLYQHKSSTKRKRRPSSYPLQNLPGYSTVKRTCYSDSSDSLHNSPTLEPSQAAKPQHTHIKYKHGYSASLELQEAEVGPEPSDIRKSLISRMILQLSSLTASRPMTLQPVLQIYLLKLKSC